jgi:hypothetical protein
LLFAAYNMALLTRGQAHVAAYGLLHVALDCHAVSATRPCGQALGLINYCAVFELVTCRCQPQPQVLAAPAVAI